MSRNLLPRYKCERIAREVTRLLKLSPALDWRQVREYAEPRLPGMPRPDFPQQPEHKRPLIASALLREIEHQHAWSR